MFLIKKKALIMACSMGMLVGEIGISNFSWALEQNGKSGETLQVEQNNKSNETVQAEEKETEKKIKKISLKGKSRNTCFSVSWDSVKKSKKCQVYLSESKNSGYKKIGTCSKKSWFYYGGRKKKTINYVKVAAFNKDGEKIGESNPYRLKKAKDKANRWDKLYIKEYYDTKLPSVMFVKYHGDAKARFTMYIRKKSVLKQFVSCKAYIGKKGINKKKEGDMRTPTGSYSFVMGFGQYGNIKTQLPYKKITKYLYWSSSKRKYNQLVDIRKEKNKNIAGEHLIQYKMPYEYALALDYNNKYIYNKGSAIFLHCTGSRNYTSGCIAIDRKNMKKVLCNTKKKTKIHIYNDK